jgi:hypothetical protein
MQTVSTHHERELMIFVRMVGLDRAMQLIAAEYKTEIVYTNHKTGGMRVVEDGS